MKRLPLAVVLLVAGCSPKPVVKPVVQAPAIQRIAVQTFEGNGGAEVTRAFAQVLKDNGFNVVPASGGADAILSGRVIEYAPRRKTTVFLGMTTLPSSGGQTIKSSNPVFSLNSSQNLTQISAMNANVPQIVAEAAVVGVVVRLVDARGTVVWADQYDYESLDLPAALQASVSVLARSLKRTLAAGSQRAPRVNKG